MSKIITIILVTCSIIGAIDKIFGNKLGYGRQFEEGIREMGNFTLSMVGIYCLSPVIANVLQPVLIPIYKLLKIDPSIFLGSLLATDMGGYVASIKLAQSPEMIGLSGLILASMLGTTVSFIIPMATTFVSDRDFAYFSKGCLAGIITVPIGVFVGGIMIKTPMSLLLLNLIPIILISLLIVIGLIKAPEVVIRAFTYLGKIILYLSMFGLLISILKFMLGLDILPDMLKFEEAIMVVAKIAIILSGAYTLISFLSKILSKNLESISKKINMNESSILGLFTSLVNVVPMLAIFDKMDWRGKIINAAFAVSGAFTLGGQLAFISTVSEETVVPFIVSKLIAGFTAVMVSIYFIKMDEKKIGV